MQAGARLTDVCGLLFELSSHDRLRMLLALDEKPMIATRIAQKLDLTVQEASRHLSRLEAMGLTEKDPEGLHHAGRYGRLVLGHLPGLEFTFQHRSYFSTHAIDALPREFLCRLGELGGSTLTEDVMIGFHNVDKMLGRAEQYVWTATDQYLPSQAPYFQKALERGITMRNIDAPYSIPPQEQPEEWERPEFEGVLNRARAKGQLEERLLDGLDVYLFMSEKEVAAVAFPLPDGRFDYAGFSSSDGRAIQWCRDLYEHYWQKGRPREEVINEHQRWLLRRPGAIDALRKVGQGKEQSPGSQGFRELEDRRLISQSKLTYLGHVLYGRLTKPRPTPG